MPYVDLGPRIRVLGTAHVSQKSVDEVRHHIEEFEPDIVAVELCQARHDALLQERRFDKEGLLKVIKDGKAPLVLLQSMLSAEQRRLGLDENLQPGAALLAAVEEGKNAGKEIALIDRDIQVTLRRAWKRMTFFQKVRLLMGMLFEEDDEEEEISTIFPFVIPKSKTGVFFLSEKTTAAFFISKSLQHTVYFPIHSYNHRSRAPPGRGGMQVALVITARFGQRIPAYASDPAPQNCTFRWGGGLT